uniref:Uncharacterized protein n=1 Tax=viral metagenome TaxID=1070528 RepID=A0A6C0AN36_9ZZZZ
MVRNLWTDGWNSFWHFIFGALTFYFPVILIMFLLYQAFANKGLYEKNVTTDLLEYFLGMISITAASYTFNQVYEIPHELFTEIVPDILSVL